MFDAIGRNSAEFEWFAYLVDLESTTVFHNVQ